MLVFFEKPGCIGNARQKALLVRLGHSLEVRNLLGTPWTPDELKSYFADLPVREWFNRSAPAVRDGQIDIDALDADAALALLVAEPLLIRRPLIDSPLGRCAGFLPGAVLTALGVTADAADLDNCAVGSAAPANPAPSCDELAAACTTKSSAAAAEPAR
jgi:nitrogenase-associated protein